MKHLLNEKEIYSHPDYLAALEFGRFIKENQPNRFELVTWSTYTEKGTIAILRFLQHNQGRAGLPRISVNPENWRYFVPENDAQADEWTQILLQHQLTRTNTLIVRELAKDKIERNRKLLLQSTRNNIELLLSL